jgi:dipeptidyl aminopeptidase/acylaminoacyl peptidase
MATATIAAAACGPAVAAAPAPSAAAADTVTAFAEIPFIEQAALSPDGTFMAGLFGVAGERRICTMSLFDATKKHCIPIPDGTEPLALSWVDDHNILVSLERLADIGSPQLIGPGRIYTSRVFGMNRDTGMLTRLLPELKGAAAAEVLWMATDGSPIIEVAGEKSLFDDDAWPAVYRVNVETGHDDQVERSHYGVWGWAADSRGAVRTGVTYNDDSRTMRMLYRGEQGDAFKTIERANTRQRQELIYPVLFLPGSDHALVTHNDDNGFNTLYEMDLTTQKDLRTVYAAGENREITAVQTDPGATTLLRAFDSGADYHVHWFDTKLAELQAQFDKAVGGADPAIARRASIVSLSRDRKRMLVRVDRPDSPGGLYYYNVDGGAMFRIAWYSQRLAARPQSPVTLVHYQARDGLPIEAVLTLPKGRAAKDLPIVLLPHGGPWAQDELAYDYWAQFIASLGYAVLQPNFRGSTGYGTPFLRKGEGQLGLAMQDDITDGLRWAAAQGIADPKRACIVGASYGGYAAMWGIAKDPDLYRCAIAVAGVASLRREVDDFGNYLMQNKFTDDWKRMTPDFLAVSPINAIPAIKAPLLLIHGEKDVTVDVGQSKSMYKRMLAAGKQVQFVDLPLADHHFGREADRKVLLTAMGAFLAKYNPADPLPAQVASAAPHDDGGPAVH